MHLFCRDFAGQSSFGHIGHIGQGLGLGLGLGLELGFGFGLRVEFWAN